MKTIALMLIGVVILVAIAIVLAVVDRGLEPEPVDHRDLGLPDRPLTARDIAGLRFRVGWRGYRMEDVDAALDRLSEALQSHEGGTPATIAPTIEATPVGSPTVSTATIPALDDKDSGDLADGLDLLEGPQE